MNTQGFDILKCYEILDIRPGATVETVRKAYVELAHVWDPTKHVGNPPLMQVAELKRKEIDAAYQALQTFLPDLSKGVPPAPTQPERPADAISDEPAPLAAAETSFMLFSFLALLIIGALAVSSYMMWRYIHHPLSGFTDVTAEQ